jgi:PEP-CTERM motif-containing protein
MRRTALTMGVLLMALLPVTAAVSTDAATPEDIPVAIAQPIGRITTALGQPSATPVLPEPGMMILVGSGLLGLATVVRRSTRV